jgi:hypothetical protein
MEQTRTDRLELMDGSDVGHSSQSPVADLRKVKLLRISTPCGQAIAAPDTFEDLAAHNPWWRQKKRTPLLRELHKNGYASRGWVCACR